MFSLNEVLGYPLNLIRFPSIFTFFFAANAMSAVPTTNGVSPKPKRKRASKGGMPLIFPGSSTSLLVGVTASAALKSIEALQSIPELVAMVHPAAGAPPIVANASGATQMDTSEQAPVPLEDLTSREEEYDIAVDEELKQAELLLE